MGSEEWWSLHRWLSARWTDCVRAWKSICNIVSWIPALWCDGDWDWVFIYRMLHHKLNNMADNFDRYGHHTDSSERAAEMRIAAALCKRISDGMYWKDPPIGPWMTRFNRWHGDRNKAPYWYNEYMIKQDIRILHSMLTKKIRYWWD